MGTPALGAGVWGSLAAGSCATATGCSAAFCFGSAFAGSSLAAIGLDSLGVGSLEATGADSLDVSVSFSLDEASAEGLVLSTDLASLFVSLVSVAFLVSLAGVAAFGCSAVVLAFVLAGFS